MTWTSQAIKDRMLEMINANYMFGVENNTRHGLYDLGCQPSGGVDSQWNYNEHNCGGGCGHDHSSHSEESGTLSVLNGWDLDDPNMQVN